MNDFLALLGRIALATLFILPSVFAMIQQRAGRTSASLDPFDRESDRYVETATSEAGVEYRERSVTG